MIQKKKWTQTILKIRSPRRLTKLDRFALATEIEFIHRNGPQVRETWQ
jgi:hypothetical protein